MIGDEKMGKITIGGKEFFGNYETRKLKDLNPNPNQPRDIPSDPYEFQQYMKTPRMKHLINAIIGNVGIIEPLWVEQDGTIIDGHRRYYSSKEIVDKVLTDETKLLNKLELEIPCFVFKNKLTEKERLWIWINIHKTRKDWNAKEKESAVIKALKEFKNIHKVSEITGMSIRQIEKLKQVWELSQKLKTDKGISYAREYLNLSKHIRNPILEKKIIYKVNKKIIKSPLEIRKLRKIYTSTHAMREFLKNGTTIETAMKYVEPTAVQKLTEIQKAIEKISKLTKCPYCGHTLP